MVNEFPELQGIMGGYYARAAGEPQTVAEAITEHYQPRSAADSLPTSDLGKVLSLADRLDTLLGIFAIGLKPTGNRDPFALRRAALGLVRILLATNWPLRLDQLLAIGAEALSEPSGHRAPTVAEVPAGTMEELREFILERARSYFLSGEATARQMAAVLAAPLGTLGDLGARVEAVGRFMSRPEGESLISANKRIGNILRKQKDDISRNIDPDLFTLSEERRLFEELSKASTETGDQFGQGDYDGALRSLAALREPVDDYFDQVMVMDEDPRLRGNRLAMLARLKSLFDRVADFSVTD
jgi:glycyl-tRNA synthetase beta chain